MKNYLMETVVFDKNEFDLFMRNSENKVSQKGNTYLTIDSLVPFSDKKSTYEDALARVTYNVYPVSESRFLMV